MIDWVELPVKWPNHGSLWTFCQSRLLRAQCTRAAGVHPHGGVVSANLPRKHVVKVRVQPSPQWERGVANTFARLYANFNHIFNFFAAIAWGVIMRSLQHPLAGLTAADRARPYASEPRV